MPPDSDATRQMSLFDTAEWVPQWRIRRSDRARRLSARVFVTGRVEIVVPRRASERRVQDFLQEHRAWIERKQADMRARQPAGRTEAFPPESIELHAFGDAWRLHLAAVPGAPRMSSARACLLVVRGGSSDRRALHRFLVRWLSDRGRRQLAPDVEKQARWQSRT